MGGKSPAILSADVPLNHAAERIAFGKTLNAGQTCVAPDYVLVPHDRVEGFVEAYRQAVQRLYPQVDGNPDYTSIINTRQHQRLSDYLDDARDKGATVITLTTAGAERRMSPTLLLNVDDSMRVMQDEIFGPLLPVVPYERLSDALAYIAARPRPGPLLFRLRPQRAAACAAPQSLRWRMPERHLSLIHI